MNGAEDTKEWDQRLAPPVKDALKKYQEAEADYRQHPKDPEVAWKLGKACFDMADNTQSKSDRAKYANRGIAVTRAGTQVDTNSAWCFYYLGLNIGQLARTKTFTALRLIRPMQDALERAKALDPAVEHGGPDRTLGLLYRDAPSLIVGDKKKAREHLTNAVKVAPNWPENYLELIAGCLEWGDKETARAQLKALEAIWPGAREEFSGAPWEESWVEWERQLRTVKAKLEGG